MPGLTSQPPPTEGLSLSVNDVDVYFNADKVGKATLHIAQSRLAWVMESGASLSLSYDAITFHAVSKDKSAFPHHCLLLMLDGDASLDWSALRAAESAANPAPYSELRFVPADEEQLQPMFLAMSDCQALHDDDEENDGDCCMEEDVGEEEEGEEEEDASNFEGTHDPVVVESLSENLFPVSECCPNEGDMTPAGLATLKRLEAMLGDDENGAARFEDAAAENDAAAGPSSSSPMVS